MRGIEKQQEDNNKKDVEMEITWGLGTKAKTEKLVAEKLKQNEELTPFEQYLEKRKAKKKAKMAERKKLREGNENESENSDSEDGVPSDIDMNDPYFAEEFKNVKPKSKKKSSKERVSEIADSVDEEQRNAELELLLMDKTEDEGRAHFDMKKIEENESSSKSKKKRQKKLKKYSDKIETVDDFKINVHDQRFEALFKSHHFNIDPADPRFRKTKGTEALIEEKMKRRADGELEQVRLRDYVFNLMMKICLYAWEKFKEFYVFTETRKEGENGQEIKCRIECISKISETEIPKHFTTNKIVNFMISGWCIRTSTSCI